MGNHLKSPLPVFQSSSVKVPHEFDMHTYTSLFLTFDTCLSDGALTLNNSSCPWSLISTSLLDSRTARTCNRRNCFNSLVRWCDASAGSKRCGLCGFDTAGHLTSNDEMTSSARFRGPSQEGLGAVSISAFAAQEVTLLEILRATQVRINDWP